MKNIITIAKRELGSYFNSAIAYIYLIVFIAINNVIFISRYFLIGKADMKAYFDSLPMVLLIFIPVVTMRLWAEDKKEHTFELLLTLPISAQELVLGKFLAAFIFYLSALSSTFTVPLVLYLSGSPDTGAVIAGYLGLILSGMFFLSVGIFISALTQEQIVAFILTTLSLFGVLFLGSDFMAYSLDGWIWGLGTFLRNYVGASSHLVSFSRGVLDLKDAAYFICGSAVFLILNGLSLEGRLKPKAKFTFTIAVFICLCSAVAFNWLVHDLRIGRFDLTEGKIYTVSKVSENILRGLKAPLTVNLYITPQEKMPTGFKTLESDIRGKLEELKLVSAGKFNFKVYHIEAARLLESVKDRFDQSSNEEPLEKKLHRKGIVPFQVESIERDELGLKLVYSA
ncbi:MAG: Gldg family protein, partial [Candidatus Omnitrophica bacterium]|nr:Gldg family protein [Candidatus Omnitrophota bacterium]